MNKGERRERAAQDEGMLRGGGKIAEVEEEEEKEVRGMDSGQRVCQSVRERSGLQSAVTQSRFLLCSVSPSLCMWYIYLYIYIYRYIYTSSGRCVLSP